MDKVQIIADIKALPKNKILSITQKVGALATSCLYKVFDHTGLDGKKTYHVVTYKGIIDFIEKKKKAVIYGKIGVHYQTFKTPASAATFMLKHDNKL